MYEAALNEELKDETLRQKLFPKNLVLAGYRGSVAHNMYVPETDPNSIDDVDLMGVHMFPVESYLGLNSPKDTVENFIGKWDVVSYEFKKFTRLLLNSNPNVLSLLWLKNDQYFKRHWFGRALLCNRHFFISKKAHNAYTGYAIAQLKRMDKFTFEGYMGKKRKALVEKFGYDCKNAAHCIRLLKMGIEFIETGELNVYRTDATDLLKIKRGEWSLDEVKEEADRLLDRADKSILTSTLPEEPMYGEVDKIVQRVIWSYIDTEYLRGTLK